MITQFVLINVNRRLLNLRTSNGATAIYLCAQEGQFACLEALACVPGAERGLRAADGMSVLHAAALGGHAAIVDWCLRSPLRASLPVRPTFGTTFRALPLGTLH